MHKAKHDGNGSVDEMAAAMAEGADPTGEEIAEQDGQIKNDLVATVATVAVVGIGAAVFEAALLPGIILGVAAVAAPRVLPKAGAALNPLFRATVRGVYKMGQKTKEVVAEAQEQVHDIVAEVHAEDDAGASKSAGAASN